MFTTVLLFVLSAALGTAGVLLVRASRRFDALERERQSEIVEFQIEELAMQDHIDAMTDRIIHMMGELARLRDVTQKQGGMLLLKELDILTLEDQLQIERAAYVKLAHSYHALQENHTLLWTRATVLFEGYENELAVAIGQQVERFTATAVEPSLAVSLDATSSLHQWALSLPCHTCHQPAGQPCTSKSGNVIKALHSGRIRAGQDQLHKVRA